MSPESASKPHFVVGNLGIICSVDEPSPEQLLRGGQEALMRADLETARTCFEQACAVTETGDALDGLSDVAQLSREYEQAIELKQRAFAAYSRDGRPVQAADVARALAFLHGTYHGNFSVASGWIERAKALLEDVEECAGHGWLALDHAPFSRDAKEREQLATVALGIARRYKDAGLEFDALALLGEAKVASGQVAEGMRMLDLAMLAISAGEVRDHFVVGEIYCRLLSACETAVDVRRATEWMTLVDRGVVWSDFVRPTCRTHYGGILTAVGRWNEAEAELLAAIDAFEHGYRGDRIFALVRLADLRLRQGRFEEAERLVETGSWHPTARRAAAVIALVRGQLALARELAQLCMDGEDTSNPACAPVLELMLDVQLARGDLAGAGETVETLEALAGRGDFARLEGTASLARGRVAAAELRDGAKVHLARAFELFGSLGLPLEAARAQLELARALATTAPKMAVREGKLALAEFERLGAGRDADGVAELLRSLGERGGRVRPRGGSTLTKRETEVLALLADGLTNAEIAQRLVISQRTAEHHVASVLTKLDLRSRAEAAAYAVREGLERPVGE
jgi:DNA-binding CsgD family transcriptional regulator